MNTVDLIPIIFVGGAFIAIIGCMLLEYAKARNV
jgi:hypothetical protein|tara:strand:+ start:335 stop:436 length:102 start_codon:yes stop_codon:yes gene_type:complete